MSKDTFEARSLAYLNDIQENDRATILEILYAFVKHTEKEAAQ